MKGKLIMKNRTIFAILGLTGLMLCFSCMSQEPTTETTTDSADSMQNPILAEIKDYNADEIKKLYEQPEYLCATDAILKACKAHKLYYLSKGNDKYTSDVCARIRDTATQICSYKLNMPQNTLNIKDQYSAEYRRGQDDGIAYYNDPDFYRNKIQDANAQKILKRWHEYLDRKQDREAVDYYYGVISACIDSRPSPWLHSYRP